MRTRNILTHLLVGAMLCCSGSVVGQASVLGNNGTVTDFLGWNASPGNNFPLQIRHDGPYPIDFWTSQSFRARINPKISYTLNTFPGIAADGFTLITPDQGFLTQASGPYSRLHLAEGGTSGSAEQFGYRPWQRNGVTFTGNGDQGYLGQKYNADNETDMVIQWSDNPGNWKGDRMRFIFTSGYNGSPTGMNSEEGLEGMRLYPTVDKGINVGIGDFYAAGNIDPAERLDVLDGRVRIRQLPLGSEAVNLNKFMVVDNMGVVRWRYLPVVPPAPSCDWTLNPTTHNNVSSAFGGADPNCPDDGDAVGIGVDLGSAAAPAKLNVVTDDFSTALKISSTKPGSFSTGVNVLVTGATDINRGLTVDCHGVAGSNYGISVVTDSALNWGEAGHFVSNDSASYAAGVRGYSNNGRLENYGVRGVSYAMADLNVGVSGEAVTDSSATSHKFVGVAGTVRNVPAGQIGYGVRGRILSVSPTERAYGVFGQAPVDTNSWAGYFQGKVRATNYMMASMYYTYSDASIKAGVENLEDADVATKLAGLVPRRYHYSPEAQQRFGLPAGDQFGFVAQEAETAVPELVVGSHVPAEVDSTGTVIYPEMEIKAVNYQGLISLLVKGYQQQQATIAQLQQQIAQCCAANQGLAPQGYQEQRNDQGGDLQEQRLLIIPNPVADLTTLEYYVPKAGQVSLSVSTSDGKPLGTLREEQAEAGGYSYQWNTTKLAAGTYFCTYLLDGAVVVKRAVKVSR